MGREGGERRKETGQEGGCPIHGPTGGKEERCTQLYPSIQGRAQKRGRGVVRCPVVLNALFVVDSQPAAVL